MSRYTLVIGVLFVFTLATGIRAEERDVDEKVIVQLDRNLPEVNFSGQDLADVIDFLRDVSGANIFVNWRDLEAAGITKTAKVKLRAKDLKFRQVIKQILTEVGTDKGKAEFTVRDGVIIISTASDPAHPRAAVTVGKLPPKLDRNVPEINFNGQAVSDVIDFMRDITGAKINLDWPSLQAAGISKDSPVVVRVRAVKVATVLQLILESVSDGKAAIDCTYADDMVKITGKPVEKNGTPKKTPN